MRACDRIIATLLALTKRAALAKGPLMLDIFWAKGPSQALSWVQGRPAGRNMGVVTPGNKPREDGG